eukprot:2865012-Amphidinium_carterae.1
MQPIGSQRRGAPPNAGAAMTLRIGERARCQEGKNPGVTKPWNEDFVERPARRASRGAKHYPPARQAHQGRDAGPALGDPMGKKPPQLNSTTQFERQNIF